MWQRGSPRLRRRKKDPFLRRAMSWIVDRGSPDDAALTKLASLNPPQQHAAAAETASGGAASSLAHSRTEGKRATAGGGASISGTADRIGGDFAVSANPEWIAKRLAVLERIKERNAAAMAGLSKPAIVVTLPDGKQLDGTAWETSPLAIAEGISSGLAKATCVASVKYSKRLQGFGAAVVDADREDGTEGGAATEEAGWELWDVTRALEGDCELKLHKFDDAEGNEVFWHSSAHILGQALETLYGCKLTHGPPLEPGAPSGGFFYDSYMGDVPFNTAMAVEVEKAVKKVCDAKQPFERVVVSKADGAPRRPCRCARAQPSAARQIRPAPLADLSLRARAIRRQHSSSLRTIRSRWRSSRRSCPTTRRPQYTGTDRSSTCAAGRTCRRRTVCRHSRSRRIPGHCGSAKRAMTHCNASMASPSRRRRRSRSGRRCRRKRQSETTALLASRRHASQQPASPRSIDHPWPPHWLLIAFPRAPPPAAPPRPTPPSCTPPPTRTPVAGPQELFFFDDLSPGSCFFLPHGCRLYNRLMEVIREQYWRRGYSEVVTPNMFAATSSRRRHTTPGSR